MTEWTCPECGRQFGRNKQSHECAPAMALEDYFATGPAHERPIFVLSRSIDHPKIARKLQGSSNRTHHVVNLRTPEDLDEDVCGWLTESYLDSAS